MSADVCVTDVRLLALMTLSPVCTYGNKFVDLLARSNQSPHVRRRNDRPRQRSTQVLLLTL